MAIQSRTNTLSRGGSIGVATPGCSTEDDLDLLSTRETPHRVVRNELGLKTEVGEMSLNLATNDVREKEFGTLELELTS